MFPSTLHYDSLDCFRQCHYLNQVYSLFFTLYSIDTDFDTSTLDSFENLVGKGEIALNEQFLLFPQGFLLIHIMYSPFVHIFDIISFFPAELEDPKIGI